MKSKLTSIQLLGIGLFIVTIFVYLFLPNNGRNNEGLFLINYGIAVLYFLLSFGDIKKGTKIYHFRVPRLNWHILLSILAVSCFTFNKEIHIFSPIPFWLEIFLLISLIAFMTTGISFEIPPFAKVLCSFIAGISILLYLYYSIVLFPYAPFALIGLFLLGLSIHLLIPFFLLVTLLTVTFKRRFVNASSRFIFMGFCTGLITITLYTGLYTKHLIQLNSTREEIILNEAIEVPEWIAYAQKCSSKYWTKRIVGTNLLYDVFDQNWWGFGFNTGSFSEIKLHDPLVAIAASFNKELQLSRKEKIKILSATTNSRHYAYEKLWSGKDLEVTQKLTDIRIYPEYRIAYQETSLWIQNNNEWPNNQQEALFTFQLPEGAVASSLSLWIDGQEEHSRLTTRKKAANAYKTIVGIERCDPVVLHWQEGNRLTATVFPCTPKETRRLKIGLTIPLNYYQEKLTLNNIKIQGPDDADATEIIHIKLAKDTENISLPKGFKEEQPNQFIYNGQSLNNWSCSLPAVPLSRKAFAFNDKTYQLKPIQPGTPFTPDAIYLDINQSWNQSDIIQILNNADNIPVYMHHNTMIRITHETLSEIPKLLYKRSFSLFPVHKIANQNALLITKGQDNSPIPSDLEGSKFYSDLVSFTGSGSTPVNTVILDACKSSYINTLEQYKCLECQILPSAKIQSTPVSRWFTVKNKLPNSIYLTMSGSQIIPGANYHQEDNFNTAPSHLMRLYNYHSILQQAGHLFLQKDSVIPDKIYQLCNDAFIVTPVSSLIVLETIEDYNRFGIEENKNSLKNASLKDSGAVPEPGEWALIITFLVMLSLTYLKFRN